MMLLRSTASTIRLLAMNTALNICLLIIFGDTLKASWEVTTLTFGYRTAFVANMVFALPALSDAPYSLAT